MRSILHTLIYTLFRRKLNIISIASDHQITSNLYFSTGDRITWRDHWLRMGQPWRTEPEIDRQRQEHLAQRRAFVPDIEQGSYPFKDMKLSRADVEWLLATHENGCGPVNWDDENQRVRKGLDLRGANLSEEDLNTLPLARVLGGLTWEEWLQVSPKKRYMAEIRLEGTNLTDAHMEGAYLGWARMKGANLTRTHMEAAMLDAAHLEGTDLSNADLTDAQLKEAHLEGAYLEKTNCEKSYLCEAFFDSGTQLINVSFDSALLADVRWSSTNLAVLNWSSVKRLGDEIKARQQKKDEATTQLYWYYRAVRANRQVAVALQAQGLNEEAARFAYRAQVLQKSVFRFQMFQPEIAFIQRVRLFGSWLFSWFLYLLAGYGYRPGRSVIVYLLMIGIFAVIYFLFGMATTGTQHLQWYEALVVSLTAFHGRGFFSEQFKPGDPEAFVAAIEAVVGLVIEISFIATFTQRFFGK